jgi:ZIP family zinc transporter
MMEAGAQHLVLAFGITLLAGLATGVGSAIAYFARHTNLSFLAVSLGFSGGVMLYVSFTEILRKGEAMLAALHGERAGAWYAAGGFFVGLAVMALVDWLVPGESNPHEPTPRGELDAYQAHPDARVPSDKLLRMGLFSALAIAVHNFPEGIATFLAALEDPHLGVAIGIAVAIHNIPEGIAVSVPIFYATGNRRRAFSLSFLSGLSEPVGAAVGYLLLRAFFTESVMGLTFALVAGIMVYISLDELLPTAREYGAGHQVLGGLLAGMAVMALSLLLLK